MLFGVNLAYWGIVCLVIAVLYFFAWPRPREDTPRPRWAAIVLRFFHPLVWLLLALTCFLWGAFGPVPARPFAALAVVCYVVFMVAFMKYGSRGR